MTTIGRPTPKQALCPSMLLWTYSFLGLSVAAIVAVIAGMPPLMVAVVFLISLAAIGSWCSVLRRRS